MRRMAVGAVIGVLVPVIVIAVFVAGLIAWQAIPERFHPLTLLLVGAALLGAAIARETA